MKKRILMPLLILVICLSVFVSCDTSADFEGILNDWINSLETETGMGGGNNQFPQGGKWPQVNQGTQAETDGVFEKPDHVHTYGELLDLINNDGLPCDERVYYRVCSVCENTKIVYGSSSDHVSAKTPDPSDNCNIKCTICNDVLESGRHTVEKLAGKEPTCSSKGLTEGQRCTQCGLVLVEQTVIPNVDHEYHINDHGINCCKYCGIVGVLPVGESYTWKDAVSVLSTNWNPHTYQNFDDSYPVGYLTSGLYTFFYNDEVIYKSTNGADPYAGYLIAPEMAAAMPVDITEQVKAEHPEFNIPDDATFGYAYKIVLNPDATWQNGEAINADTYVYSMKQLLDPNLRNYRASDYCDGDFAIANAKNYYYQRAAAYNALGTSAEMYLANGGDVTKLYINMDFWGCVGALDAEGNEAPEWILVTDDTMYRDLAITDPEAVEAWVSAKYLYETYLAPNTPYAAYGAQYLGTATEYADNYSFDNVGLYKSGDYEITLVLEKPLAGFNLLYKLTNNWLVYEKLYEAGKTQSAGTNNYCSSVATTMSYGPYKMIDYQPGKYMKLIKNENWFGYTDGKHVYVDPIIGEIFEMYQTDTIVCQVVKEANTRKLMFLKGELMGYGLRQEDFAEYRKADRAYVTPSESTFFLLLNGHLESIRDRENDYAFDKTKYDLETITLNSFRRAFAVTYDKEAFAITVSPSRSGGYGLIGPAYVYDPETGARYRDTDQAKRALCEFYSVDVSEFESLDAAYYSITGYDPETAKALFTEAYYEAIEAGYITDNDGDGRSDQTVRIEYCSSATSDFMQTTIKYLNDKLNEVVVGTPFEGKIEIYESAPYGYAWSDKIMSGMSDAVLAGWSGSALDPFSNTEFYTNPSKQYDAKWFDAQSVDLTLTIEGEELTMNLKQWSDALNGTAVEIDGREYNFGDGIASADTRLDILAAIETEILKTYNYIPMLQDGSVSLLSKQVYYVVEEYNPIMGRGGIAYTRYNYNDAEWAEYVASCGGQVKY